MAQKKNEAAELAGMVLALSDRINKIANALIKSGALKKNELKKASTMSLQRDGKNEQA